MLCLYLSTLALVVPWVVLRCVRITVEPGLFRAILSVALFCLPMVLTLGLLFFARPLGLDDGDQSIPDSLVVIPPAFIAAFAVLFVAPWLGVRAIWHRLSTRFERTITSMSSIARLMACVAVIALLLTTLRYPGLVCPLALCVVVGNFVVLLISQEKKPSPIRLNHERRPDETGYVARADGDDPFA